MSHYAVPRERLIELLSLPKKRVCESVLELLGSCEELVEEDDGDLTDTSVESSSRKAQDGSVMELLPETGSVSSDTVLASVDSERSAKESQKQ